MKQLQRILSVLLAAGCALSASACGQEPASSSSEPSVPASSASQAESSQTEPAGVTYPIPGNIRLTYAMQEEQQITAYFKTFGETPLAKAWQEATGVTIEFQHPSGADGFNLLFASGELPDIIQYNFVNAYPGGCGKAISEKVIAPITELIETDAPDLYRVLNENDIYRKSVTTSKGDIAGFPMIQGESRLGTNAGLMVRQDWLDDLNMEVPVTADDFYQVLKAFQEEKQASAPFSLSAWWLKTIVLEKGEMTSAFGIPQLGFYQKDGKIYNGYIDPKYKDLLEYLKKLYDEGLLDTNFATLDGNTQNANFMGGISGITAGNMGGGMGNYLSTMASQNPDFDVSAIGSLVAQKGDRPMSTSYSFPVPGNITAITTACKEKEAAARFLNYAYTDAGHLLLNFGVEGESYTIVEGKPTYTEWITKNPEGLTMQQALAQYTRAWNSGPFVQDVGYIEQYAQYPQQKKALDVWSNSDAIDYILPPLSIAEENMAEYSKIKGDIDTYIEEMFVKFITGVEPLDNFDAYLATLEQMGVQRLIELQQAALDEFNAR